MTWHGWRSLARAPRALQAACHAGDCVFATQSQLSGRVPLAKLRWKRNAERHDRIACDCPVRGCVSARELAVDQKGYESAVCVDPFLNSQGPIMNLLWKAAPSRGVRCRGYARTAARGRRCVVRAVRPLWDCRARADHAAEVCGLCKGCSPARAPSRDRCFLASSRLTRAAEHAALTTSHVTTNRRSLMMESVKQRRSGPAERGSRKAEVDPLVRRPPN